MSLPFHLSIPKPSFTLYLSPRNVLPAPARAACCKRRRCHAEKQRFAAYTCRRRQKSKTAAQASPAPPSLQPTHGHGLPGVPSAGVLLMVGQPALPWHPPPFLPPTIRTQHRPFLSHISTTNSSFQMQIAAGSCDTNPRTPIGSCAGCDILGVTFGGKLLTLTPMATTLSAPAPRICSQKCSSLESPTRQITHTHIHTSTHAHTGLRSRLESPVPPHTHDLT